MEFSARDKSFRKDIPFTDSDFSGVVEAVKAEIAARMAALGC